MEENPISSIYPPGIRFHPSDAELVSYYLERKVKCLPLPANVITDIELYRYNPWDLPRKTLFGEDEWYFFTPRERKYPNGGRPNRTAASGYWKATGTDKPIMSSCGSRKIGVKKGLVFYQGKPPKGHKMDWNMTEYRLPDTSRPSRSRGSMRLDDWVLCRVWQKGNMSKNEQEDEQSSCEFHESNIKEFPSVSINDSSDMLTDYLQSSEYNRMVTLLVGHDSQAAIPVATFESPKSGNSSSTIHEDSSEKMNIQADFNVFQSFSGSIPTNMTMNGQEDVACLMGAKSYRQHVLEGDKWKPNYPSNAYINLEELRMPALQENLLQ